jgi:hypothetical protein
LLVAAALLLSGCWANVYNFGGGQRSITLTKDISAQIIWNCTAKKGTGAPRAFCALDTVNALCRAFPIKGVSDDDCVLLASYGDWRDMDHAIQEVVGPGADCLIYYENPDPNDNFWGSIRSGIFGCK